MQQILRSLALILVPATMLCAAGEGRQEKTLDTTREPRISLTNLKGVVLVRGWDKAQVHVVSTVASPRVEVDAECLPDTGPADKVHFTTHVLDPLGNGNDQVVDYTLDVPAGSSLEIRNPQGKIRVEGMQAEADIQSVGGDIVVADFSGHLSVRSVGGNIEVLRPSGHVEAYSITGNLHFVSPTTTKLRGSTTSGHILFEGDFMERGDYILSAYSGDLDIVCPPSASFELNEKTVRGKVINSLPIKRRRESASPMASSNSLLGTHNTGKATLELTSFSGTIRIRPQM
jgi:DUF4097 and DUF4098 domain-containing protein YvlB